MNASLIRCAICALAVTLNADALFANAVSTEYPTVHASVKPVKATVGAPLEYTIEIRGKDPSGIEILVPEKKSYLPEKPAGKHEVKKGEEIPAESVPLYIVHDTKSSESAKGKNRIKALTIDLAYYRPGRHRLPQIELRDAEGVGIGYQIPEIEITATNEKGEFQEIEPPLELGGNYMRLIAVIASCAVLAALCIGAFMFIKKRRQSPAVPVVETPPLDIFLNEMRDLRIKLSSDKSGIEAYALPASAAFRRFIGKVFGFDAMEMTSAEIVAACEASSARMRYGEGSRELREAMELWDLAKFAEFTPTRETILSHMDSVEKLARRLVREWN